MPPCLFILNLTKPAVMPLQCVILNSVCSVFPFRLCAFNTELMAQHSHLEQEAPETQKRTREKESRHTKTLR